MTTIQNSFKRFSSLFRITLAAALLLTGLALAPSAQAIPMNPDITAFNVAITDVINSFNATSNSMTLNYNNLFYDQAFIQGTYSLNFDKVLNSGSLSIVGTMRDSFYSLLGNVSLTVNLTNYDTNFGDPRFMGNITSLDPLLLAAGFDVLKPFEVDFSLSDGQSNNFNTPVPEPSTIILLGAGLLGIVAASRRKRQ